MQEMAVLEGLDFKNFRGSVPPDPPSLRMPVCYKPPLQNARRDACVNQEIYTFQAYAFDAAPILQYLKDKVPFESSIFLICSLRLLHLLNGLKMQGMAVLEGPDFKNFPGEHTPGHP